MITSFFFRGFCHYEKGFSTFLIGLDFTAELLNEVRDGPWFKWGWFISVFSQTFFFSFLFFCVFHNHLYLILTTVTSLLFPQNVIYLILFIVLLSVTFTTVKICSFRFSFHLFYSHRRSWTNGTRNKTISKFSFWNSTRNQRSIKGINEDLTKTRKKPLHCEMNRAIIDNSTLQIEICKPKCYACFLWYKAHMVVLYVYLCQTENLC